MNILLEEKLKMKTEIKKILIPILAVLCLSALSLAITGCGGGLAKKLDMPLNVTLEINHRKSGTQYILNWDAVEGAEGYSLLIDGRTAESKKNTFDATEYLTPGQSSLAYVKALGNGVSTGDSDENKARVRVEAVSPVLIFKTNEEEKSVSVLSYAAEQADLAGRIVIPDYYNGLPVTEIGENAFFDNNAQHWNPVTGQNCNNATSSFRLPSKLEKIGNYAFAYCLKVKNIALPSTVKHIGEGSFMQCVRLTSINLGEVENIGMGAFAYCKALNTVELSENIQTFDSQVFFETPVANNLVGDKILNGYILYEVIDKEIESYTIPENVTCIAGGAFMGCSKLKNITIPENVKLVGSRIFANCKSLETVNIPESATEIHDYTFYNCPSITKITIPKNVACIGDGAFMGCKGLTTVELPENLTEIGNTAFSNSGIEAITLPESLKRIGDEAFRETLLKEITIPDNVRSICQGAFYNCALETVNFGKGVTEIGKYAFYGNPIAGVIIPKGVTTMEEFAFGSDKLQYVVVHNRMKLIYHTSVYGNYCKIYFEGTKEEYEQTKQVQDPNEGMGGMSAFKVWNMRFYSETQPEAGGNLLTYWRWVDGVPTDWETEA